MPGPAVPDPCAVVRERYYVGGAFVVEQRPASMQVQPTAILILPPLGYEDTCAYRPLRVLGDTLVASGHLVLRIDWPGQGDSAGNAEDIDLFGAWLGAVSEAAAALRARGAMRVAGVGVRAGALIALAAKDLDEVVLWALPGSGKAYLREERIFHKMAAKAYSAAPAGTAAPPSDAVEAGGFLYSGGTVRSIESLVAVRLAESAKLARVLLLGRDGTPPDEAVVSALVARGCDVSTASPSGLGELLENPYAASLSADVRETVVGWFGTSSVTIRLVPPTFTSGSPPLSSVANSEGVKAERPPYQSGISPTMRLTPRVVERPWVHAGQAGELSGVVCVPATGIAPNARWTLFFNAGGIRRGGPNRLWTLAARALGEAGHPSLRFDVRDVGDSNGTNVPHADLEAMYSEASIDDALCAYDWIEQQNPASVDVVGLCSGAFFGVQVASRRNVRRALLFNGLAYVWDDDARATGMTAHIRGSLFDARRWRRLVTGKIDARALVRSVGQKTRINAATLVARLAGTPPPDPVDAILASVRARGTELHLVSSEGDPSIAYFQGHVPESRRPRLTILPGVDHTIRPVWAHPRVVELVTMNVCAPEPR